jgi:uncharacterized membrane protein YciS (DUF1049 family)
MLAKFFGTVLAYLLPSLLDWLKSQVEAYRVRKETRERSQQANQAAREQTEAATTPEERERASANIINKF